MKDVTILIVLFLVAVYVNGRAVIHDEAHFKADTSNYANCMLKCEEDYEDCMEKFNKRDDADAQESRNECKYDKDECETGVSIRDENVPQYRRTDRPSCLDYTHERHRHGL